MVLWFICRVVSKAPSVDAWVPRPFLFAKGGTLKIGVLMGSLGYW